MKRKNTLLTTLLTVTIILQAQVTIKVLGSSQNLSTAYQLKQSYGALRQVYADPKTNAISYIQQGSPWYSQTKYNISKDAGATWDTSIICPSPSGRYAYDLMVQGVILNPTNSTNPNNAYFAYHNFTQTKAPSKFGYSFGTQKIDKSVGVTNNRDTSAHGYLTYDTHVQRKTNTIFVADIVANPEIGIFDTLIISKYAFNNTSKDIELSSRKRIFINSRKKANGNLSITDAKVAFSPSNTNIGYAVVLADNAVIADSVLSPLVFKTIDGGVNWIALPDINISNMPTIYNECGGAGSILTMVLELNMAVDMDDNLHIFSFIANAGGGWGSYYPSPQYQGYFDVYTKDKGITWSSVLIIKPMTYYSILGNAATAPVDYHLHDGRPQIMTDSTHSKMFYLWTDTDTSAFAISDGNKYPDVYIRANDLITDKWTITKNVTKNTAAQYSAYFATAASYSLKSGNCFSIPLVYYEVKPSILGGDGISLYPARSFYLDGIKVCDTDFTIGINELGDKPFAVSQNYPNPFNNKTSFEVSLNTLSNVIVEYYTIAGVLVKRMDMGKLQSGNYQIDMGKENLSSGVYFYTVKINENTITRKMIISE